MDIPTYLRTCPHALDNNVPGLDGDLDPLRDIKQFLGVAVIPMSAHVYPIFDLCDAGRRNRIRVRCGFESVNRDRGARRIAFVEQRTCTSS